MKMRHFCSKRILTSLFIPIVLRLAVANALVVTYTGSNSNQNNGVSGFRSAHGIIRTNNTMRKLQTKLRSQERSEQTNVLADKYVPNMFPKNKEERLFIKEALEANFIFQHIHLEIDQDNQMLVPDIVSSFEKQTFGEDLLLCKQDDTENTDYLYLIASGSCSVSKDGKVLPVPFGTIGPGSLVGDSALLYGTARAATVRTKGVVEVYRLHRTDFQHFMDFSDSDAAGSGKTNENSLERIKREVREIDSIIDRVNGMKTEYCGEIIERFKPSRKWLWSQWRGTIMKCAWKSALRNMILSFYFIVAFKILNNYFFSSHPITWPLGAIPDAGHPLIVRTKGMFKMWGYFLSIATFLLTYYLNKAYTVWRDIYVRGRLVQGLLNNISMPLACLVERDPQTGTYTDRARSLLDDIGGYVRLCHTFAWAGSIDRFNALLTPRGLSRMVSRNAMTQSQYETLVGIDKKKCEPQHATLMWIMSRLLQGMRDGVIPNDPATRSLFFEGINSLRGVLAGIKGSTIGNIPMAYAQFVQILVDTVLVMAPFALYSEMGVWSVPAVGLLNIFYNGINDLAKIMLDPLANSDADFYKGSSVNLDIGILIRESNAGSNRWKIGLEELPFQYSSGEINEGTSVTSVSI